MRAREKRKISLLRCMAVCTVIPLDSLSCVQSSPQAKYTPPVGDARALTDCQQAVVSEGISEKWPMIIYDYL